MSSNTDNNDPKGSTPLGTTPSKHQPNRARRNANTPCFAGNTSDMNRHVFELPTKPNQFAKTLEML